MAESKKKSSKAKSTKASTELMENLKTFVRTRGAEYLRDNNITSVGIGYKQKTDESTGKENVTNEIAIQFTVEQKAVPEMLSELNTNLIPPSFDIGGVEVPTDVIQRKYEPSYRIVDESVRSSRKSRIDPIVPGVSVANHRVSAGTIGCIVYDRHNGTPYVLSNWHVLHGPLGSVGDDVVQPGPHDDDRVDLNRLGKLVRSHLGPAGDCAIASIEDRGFEPAVLDLNTQINKMGETELGDKVIKSGRTTGVTHGIVQRIHTITRLNYGGDVGNRNIGGFEIGPDPAHPAANGEISMGGDSGSVWLFKLANGRTSQIMAGLHFAGESSFDPNERALACYPRSVFEKLDISLSPPAQPAEDEETTARRGYEPNFLGQHVALPILTIAGRKLAYKERGSEVIPYTHFSLALDKTRRFAMWVAWNIDGGWIRRVSRKGIPFVLDPDIPARYQVDNSLYVRNPIDRGHIARRADLCWGDLREAKRANRDSFFFTNITPQMDDFNQSSRSGIWGRLENAVFEDADVDDLRVSVFGGPVFRDDDRVYRGIKIPREYFKVISFVEAGNLKTRAFLLTQNLDELEVLDLDEFRLYQVTLAEIEQRCAFRFPDILKSVDAYAEVLSIQPELAEARTPLEALGDIMW